MDAVTLFFEVSQFERWSGLVSKIELLSTFILPKFFSVWEQLPTCGIFFLFRSIAKLTFLGH